MLRAAKRLIFETAKIKSHSGLLLSPCININGLIIRADRSMQEQQLIKDFLNSKGAIVHRLKINNELYVSIYGKYFQLTIEEVREFLAKNKELSIHQTTHLDNIPVAHNLINALNGEYYENLQSTVARYTDGNEIITIPPETSVSSRNSIEICYNEARLEEPPYIEPITPYNTIASSQHIDAICDDLTRIGSKMLAAEDIKILTNSMMCDGKVLYVDRCTEQEIEQIAVGLMNLHISLNNISVTCKQPAKLTNTALSAANTVTFKGSAELSIDPSITWLNNPCRDMLPMFRSKNNIRKLQTTNPIQQQSVLNNFKPFISQ